MKKRIVFLGLAFLGAISFAGCSDNESNTTPGTQEDQSEYKVKISAIGGAKSIKVTKTVKLRATVTNTTKKDVTWSSSDESIASVDQTGLVTGLKAGEVEIKATLKLDSNAYAVYKLTVEDVAAPTEIRISGAEDNSDGWVGEECKLDAVATPKEASNVVSWTSSNDAFAKVDSDGKVSFIAPGAVVITATSKADSNIKAEIHFNVKKGYFQTETASPLWHFEHQGDVDGFIELSDLNDDDSKGYNSAWFAGCKDTHFYVEATFLMKRQTKNTWDWQGFGLGAGLDDTDARYFTYSPHSAVSENNHNKIILRDKPDTWGPLTDRTQIWGEHGLNDIKETDEVKIGLLRNGNDYYYLVNDVVQWFDVNTKYDGIPTSPFVLSWDLPVKVSKYSATAGEEIVANELKKDTYHYSFYSSHPSVEYTSDKQFSFTSNTEKNKDNKCRSVGDMAKVVRNFEVEFDIDTLNCNREKTNIHTGLTVNLQRYDNANSVETISFGTSAVQAERKFVTRFTRWNFPGFLEEDASIFDWMESGKDIFTDANSKHHIKIVRRIDEVEDIATFEIYVDDVRYDFNVNKKNKNITNPEVYYTGAYLIWLGGEYASANITNFEIRSNVQ